MIHDLARTLELGGYTFPTREDYLARYAAGRSVEGLSAETIVTIQRDWHMRGQNGCVFAMHAARNLSNQQWRYEVLFDHQDVDLIRGVITRAVADPHNDVLSLVFPQVATAVQVQGLVCAALKAGCHLAEDVAGEAGVVALRYRLDGADSWVVGFAPLDDLPATRRAPFAELAIRTKPKSHPAHPDLNDDEDQAHLADVQLGYSPGVTTRLICKTKARTVKILGGIEKRDRTKAAKAKTTFGLPLTVAHYEKEDSMKEVEKRTGLDLEAALALKPRVEGRYERKDVVNRTVVVKVENEDFSPSPDALLDIKTKLIGDRTLLSVKYGNWHTDTVRREYEVNIDRGDLGSLFAILELLGYSRFIVLSTVRTIWSGDGVVITLDEYPKLGKALLEVELEDAEQGEEVIDTVFASLDVNPMGPQQTVEFISSLNQAKEAQIDLGQVAPEELAQELVGSH
jgi:adenylate cyclase class IV